MKKFVFTMQSLLNVKISLEKQAKADLADCQARLRLFLREMDDLKLRRELQKNDYQNDMRAGGMTAADMAAYFVGFRALNERIAAQQEKIDICEQERIRIQKKVVAAMKERKMLEQLKEKQLEEYKAEVKIEDAKIIDDFMSNQLGGSTGGR